MGCFALFPYQEVSHLEVMDEMFFVGVKAGMLIFGLKYKDSINAARKEIV